MRQWATETAPVARPLRPPPGLVARLGGPARARVIVLFAAVLGLQSADLATIGAAGGQLESTLGIGHVQLGLLASASSFVSAVATLPFGVLADRAPRVRLLSIAVALWGAAMVAAGFSESYDALLGTRMVLGLLTAAAGPVMASLMGDLFPAAERAQVYGLVLSGELLGLGFGFMLSGNVAGVLSWHWALWVLALPAAALAVLLPRLLPEPARGGSSALEPGDREVLAAGAAPRRRSEADDGDERPVQRLARRQGVKARYGAVLRRDPDSLSLWQAVRYVVRVRTNVVLIAVSATLYFFLGGLETFGVIFVRHQYGLGQSAATSMVSLLGIGALAGVLSGGRIADRLLRRGRLDARVLVAAVAFLLAVALVFGPFLAAWPLLAAMPLYIAGTGALTCANPALDAARLDVMPSGLWGRSEAIRTALRAVAVASAPVAFGALSAAIGEGGGTGLRITFLVMLSPLAVAGVALLAARGGYRRDVAAAALGEEASR